MAWGLKIENHRQPAKSNQVNTLPKEKSKTRSKQNKDMHSVEEGIAEMLNIHMCLTLRICEQVGCWRNRVFLAISKHL